jgi:hypothetical protein
MSPHPKAEAGQKRPGGFAFLDPGPSALELHQRIPNNQTLCQISRVADQSAEGSVQPILRSQLRRLGLGCSHRARPRHEWLHGITFSSLGSYGLALSTHSQLALVASGGVKQPLSWVGSVGRF